MKNKRKHNFPFRKSTFARVIVSKEKRSSPEKIKIAFLFWTRKTDGSDFVLFMLPGLYWFVSLHNSYLSGNEPGTSTGRKKKLMCRKNQFENGNRLFSISRKSYPWAEWSVGIFSSSLSFSPGILRLCKKKVTTFNLWTNLTSNAAQNRPEYVCFVWSKFLFPNGLVSGGSCKMFASFLPTQSSVVMNCWSPLTLALFLHSAPAVEEILLSVIYVHLQPYRLSPTNKCFMSAQTACAGKSTHFT